MVSRLPFGGDQREHGVYGRGLPDERERLAKVDARLYRSRESSELSFILKTHLALEMTSAPAWRGTRVQVRLEAVNSCCIASLQFGVSESCANRRMCVGDDRCRGGEPVLGVRLDEARTSSSRPVMLDRRAEVVDVWGTLRWGALSKGGEEGVDDDVVAVDVHGAIARGGAGATVGGRWTTCHDRAEWMGRESVAGQRKERPDPSDGFGD